MAKSKTSSFLIAGLSVLGIVLLSGAFKSFVKWDNDQPVADGLLTVGASVVGAFLAHKAGLIDGDTRNLVIMAGASVGTYKALGTRVEEMGMDVADRFRGITTTRKRTKTPAGKSSTDPTSFDDFDGDFIGDFDEAPPVRRQAAPLPPVAAAAPAPAPVPIIQVEAPNPWVSLAGSVIQAAGSFFGSAGSGQGAVGFAQFQ